MQLLVGPLVWLEVLHVPSYTLVGFVDAEILINILHQKAITYA